MSNNAGDPADLKQIPPHLLEVLHVHNRSMFPSVLVHIAIDQEHRATDILYSTCFSEK